MKNFFSLFLASLFVGCGGGSKNPLDVQAYNQRCLEGKIEGQYQVKFTDGSHKVVYATSLADLKKRLELNEFLDRGPVLAVDYNFKIKSRSSIRPFSQSQSSSFSQEGPTFLGADHLYQMGYKGQGIKVALIDSGYDFNHPLLQNTVAVNHNDFGRDEDQNGYKGDYFGWNFMLNRPLEGDLGGHGTAVGSLIAAAHNNFYKFSIAPGARIIPIAGLEPDANASTDGSGDSNSVLLSIRYALQRGADIINASWGGEICSSFLREEIKQATESEILFVTSSGNEGLNLDETPTFPASFPFPLVLGVGAANLSSEWLASSNYGKSADFFALGHNILAASPHQQFVVASGTSTAAPYISGALALLKEAFPHKSNYELVEALKSSRNSNKIPYLPKAFKWLQNGPHF